MNLIIFERTNFEISEKNQYSFTFKHIGNSQKCFDRFIIDIVERSRNFKTYINVYRLYKDHTIAKICWINSGDLFTL